MTTKSTVSDTDLKLFINLGNPESIDTSPRADEDENDDIEEGEEDEDEGEEDIEEGEDEEEAEDEDEEDEDIDSLRRSMASGGAPRDPWEAKPVPSTSMSKEDIEYQKTAVLLELDRLRGLGCKLTRDYTVEDNLEDMEYEARRHVLALEEANNINVLKDGLRLFVSGTEYANKKFGPILNLNGFSQSVSNDINAGRYNLTLSKLHRKYFRSPGQTSPELELAFSLMGAAAFHHFQKSYVSNIMPSTNVPNSRSKPIFPPAADDDSDDELPPMI